MDVSTIDLIYNANGQPLTLKHRKKLSLLSSFVLCLMMSSTGHADELSDLIALKSQAFDQSSSISNPSVQQTSPDSDTVISNTPFSVTSSHNPSFYQSYATAPNIDPEHIDTLYQAEQTAAPASKKVLQTVRQMALDNKEIIKGSCWDYLNAAFNRAGVTRHTVFKGEYPAGPFVDTNEIQPGDWLYYVNHSYNDIEHSGLFVGWLDRSRNQALILSYAGEHRHEPARYKVYDVSHTYNIMRPSF